MNFSMNTVNYFDSNMILKTIPVSQEELSLSIRLMIIEKRVIGRFGLLTLFAICQKAFKPFDIKIICFLAILCLTWICWFGYEIQKISLAA